MLEPRVAYIFKKEQHRRYNVFSPLALFSPSARSSVVGEACPLARTHAHARTRYIYFFTLYVAHSGCFFPKKHTNYCVYEKYVLSLHRQNIHYMQYVQLEIDFIENSGGYRFGFSIDGKRDIFVVRYVSDNQGRSRRRKQKTIDRDRD